MQNSILQLAMEHINRGFFSFDEMVLLADAIRKQFHNAYGETDSPVAIFSKDLEEAIAKWNEIENSRNGSKCKN